MKVLPLVYYAQRDYREKHKCWAKGLTELGLADLKHESLARLPEMDVAGGMFEVCVKTKKDGNQWHIRQAARLWPD